MSAGQNDTFWVALRGALIEESTEAISGFSVMDNVVVLADLTVILAWYHRDTERWRAWAAFAFFIVYNVLTAGRAGFVFILLCLFTIEILKRGKVPWRAVVVFALVFAITFFGLAVLVRKAGANPDASFSENLPNARGRSSALHRWGFGGNQEHVFTFIPVQYNPARISIKNLKLLPINSDTETKFHICMLHSVLSDLLGST